MYTSFELIIEDFPFIIKQSSGYTGLYDRVQVQVSSGING